MIDEILPDSVVNAEFESNLELGSYTIGARHKNRVGELLKVEAEQTAEAARISLRTFLVEGFCVQAS